MRHLIAASLSLSVVLSTAGAAQACLPPLPQTEEQRSAALTERQVRAWGEATLIFEVEVGRVYSVGEPIPPLVPPGTIPPQPGLYVELRPVRLLRGDGEAEPVEMVYPVRSCVNPIGYSLAAGTRLIAWSRSTRIDESDDIVELLAVGQITHEPTRALMTEPSE